MRQQELNTLSSPIGHRSDVQRASGGKSMGLSSIVIAMFLSHKLVALICSFFVWLAETKAGKGSAKTVARCAQNLLEGGSGHVPFV